MTPLPVRDFGLDADRASSPESLPAALRRRLGGRYPVDPFGLDPHLADLLEPAVEAVTRVHLDGGQHVPSTGPAVLVANRGLGLAEPAALVVAVRRAAGRRLRVVGTPAVPYAGAFLRRLGGISATPEDLRAALRAGYLVAVPLAPTWLRTGAGAPPLPLLAAMTGVPVLPVAVSGRGLLGAPLRPWRVRIGPPVALDETSRPGDPLTAAELGAAVRDAVASLLAA